MGNKRIIKIALIACVKTKSPLPAPARVLYTSQLFKKSVEWAEINCDDWFVLSAKYGLVSPNTRLRPYDKTLKSATKRHKVVWAKKVFTQIKEKGLLPKKVQFCWLAGRDYKEPLATLLREFSQADPMEGLDYFKRLSWLTSEPHTHPLRL